MGGAAFSIAKQIHLYPGALSQTTNRLGKPMAKQPLTAEQREALEKVIQADLAMVADLQETLATMPASIQRIFEKQPKDSDADTDD